MTICKKTIVKGEKEVSGMIKDSEGLPCHKMVITTCDLEPGESISPIFSFFSIWLDVSHLTNEHRTQDCIAS